MTLGQPHSLNLDPLPIRGLLGRLSVALFSALTILLISFCSNSSSEQRQEIFQAAPAWNLVDQNGEKISSLDLLGKAYVVNFIWTNCPDTCPMLSLQMALLQNRLAEEEMLDREAVLVSISIDPERDKPYRLKKYAEIFKAEDKGWYFLTGSNEELLKIVTLGFGVSFRALTPNEVNNSNLATQLTPPLDETRTGQSLFEYIGTNDISDILDIEESLPYSHQNAFILVDGFGKIREYYLGTFLDRDQVVVDIKSLK